MYFNISLFGIFKYPEPNELSKFEYGNYCHRVTFASFLCLLKLLGYSKNVTIEIVFIFVTSDKISFRIF